MPSSPALPFVVPVEQIELAYDAAIATCHKRFSPGMARDYAVDRATDAVMRAAQKYIPGDVPFEAYARACVRKSILAAFAAPSHVTEQLFDNQAATAGPTPSPDWSALPGPLRAVCTFHLTYGFSLTETGLLCGISREGAAKRLRSAARIVAIDP